MKDTGREKNDEFQTTVWRNLKH